MDKKNLVLGWEKEPTITEIKQVAAFLIAQAEQVKNGTIIEIETKTMKVKIGFVPIISSEEFLTQNKEQ